MHCLVWRKLSSLLRSDKIEQLALPAVDASFGRGWHRSSSFGWQLRSDRERRAAAAVRGAFRFG